MGVTRELFLLPSQRKRKQRRAKPKETGSWAEGKSKTEQGQCL